MEWRNLLQIVTEEKVKKKVKYSKEDTILIDKAISLSKM